MPPSATVLRPVYVHRNCTAAAVAASQRQLPSPAQPSPAPDRLLHPLTERLWTPEPHNHRSPHAEFLEKTYPKGFKQPDVPESSSRYDGVYSPAQDPRDGTLNANEIAHKCFIDKKTSKAQARDHTSMVRDEKNIQQTEVQTFLKDYGNGRFKNQGSPNQVRQCALVWARLFSVRGRAAVHG